MPGRIDADTAADRSADAYRVLAGYSRDRAYTVADFFEDAVSEAPDEPFLIFEHAAFSFAHINSEANRVADHAWANGLRRGDVVALMMDNRPEYIVTWLGFAKIGIVTALLNPSTTGAALAHAFGQIEAKALVIGSECAGALAGVHLASLPGMIFERSDTHTGVTPNSDYDRQLQSAAVENPNPQVRAGLTMADSHFYIFTSGTTGLPKAAKNSHLRFISAGVLVAGQLAFGPGDTFYCVLPLFHGAGGMVVPSLAIASRTPFVLRRRFSRSAFWEDVRRHNITGFYYIGEIVRYLLTAPPREDDRDHGLRIMTGAGLRADVWEAFAERFGVSHILEGMGSTEGNYRLLNVDNRIGSVGRLPPPEETNMRVARYDFETEDILRDDDGAPVFAQAGETGELIAQVLRGNGLMGYFEGYTSAEATRAKLTTDLVEPGDCWFRSGDLVRIDEDGFLYFVDRTGDTFRWKGENVSTQEVEELLAPHSGVGTINVYGVSVPGQEGRAGMAAITAADPAALDLVAFHARAVASLPGYAVPLFLRIGRESELTATFKLRKTRLRDESYDPAAMRGDHLYVRDERAGTYVPLDDGTLRRLGLPPCRAS